MEDTVCYSIYPSEGQGQPQGEELKQHFKVFELGHQIPICESVSPVSNKRWHGFTEDEFAAYRERLTQEVFDYMKLAEEEQGGEFTMAISHHTFLNPLVMRDVLKKRRQDLGRKNIPLFCFCHGTALKMYVHELEGNEPEEFPMRFHKMMVEENVFGDGGIAGAFAISMDQAKKMKEIFPMFDDHRVVVSPNGVNQNIFYPRDKTLKDLLAEHAPLKGGDVTKEFAHSVVFVGKFANWKRLDAVLRAEKLLEAERDDVAFIIIGSGPEEDVAKYHAMADELELKNHFFLGPKPQPVLAEFFSAGDVGVFPSFSEPFGMVFIECMACGTPTIGADSGGPKDFVNDDVGHLFPEPADTTDKYDWETIEKSLYSTIKQSLDEDWKKTKNAACIQLATTKYSVKHQCEELLQGVDKLNAEDASAGADLAAAAAPEDPAAAKMAAEAEAEAKAEAEQKKVAEEAKAEAEAEAEVAEAEVAEAVAEAVEPVPEAAPAAVAEAAPAAKAEAAPAKSGGCAIV